MTTFVLRYLRNVSKSYLSYGVPFTVLYRKPYITTKYVTYRFPKRYGEFSSGGHGFIV